MHGCARNRTRFKREPLSLCANCEGRCKGKKEHERSLRLGNSELELPNANLESCNADFPCMTRTCV